VLLYLPGLDGTGYAAQAQWAGLQQLFHLQCLSLPADDLTPQREVVAFIASHAEAEARNGRQVVLLGESAGGVLALATALASPSAVTRLVLVNAATSFPRTPWAPLAPVLSQLPPAAYDLLPFGFAPFLGNPLKLLAGQLAGAAEAAALQPPAPAASPAPLEAVSAAALAAAASLSRIGALSAIIPPTALAHRLQLLAAGCAGLDGQLDRIRQPCLVVVGAEDRLLPPDEGARLVAQLPHGTLRVIVGGSHALLQEGLTCPPCCRRRGWRRCPTGPARRARRRSPPG